MTRIDFVDWTFREPLATVTMTILLLIESRDVIRTAMFDPRAPVCTD
jgi:hypothetical protein